MEFRKLPDHPFLEVSETGEIRNTITGTQYAQSLDKDGYRRVRSSKDGKFFDYRTHRAVALAFLGKPTNEDHTVVNHKDGDITNNHYSNLEWCSPKYNTLHALHVTRTSKPHNSVTDDIVKEAINLLRDTDLTYKAIGDKLSVSKKTITNISNGSSYKHLTKGVKIRDCGSNAFSEGTIRWVCRKFESGMSINDVLAASGNSKLKYMFLYKIYKRISNKKISSEYVW